MNLHKNFVLFEDNRKLHTQDLQDIKNGRFLSCKGQNFLYNLRNFFRNLVKYRASFQSLLNLVQYFHRYYEMLRLQNISPSITLLNSLCL